MIAAKVRLLNRQSTSELGSQSDALRFALRLGFGASGFGASASLSIRLIEGAKRGFEPAIPRVGCLGMVTC